MALGLNNSEEDVSFVSIIIPMKNVEAFIRDALGSVCVQDCENIEVLVIDDGSTDRSPEIVGDYDDPRVTLLMNEGRGISAGFNTGLKHATGKYLMRCDADDWFAPDRIRKQVAWMEAHPDVDVACGLQEICWQDGTTVLEAPVESTPERSINADLRKARNIPRMVTAIFRTDCLRAAGGCREYFVTCEDDDLMMRLGERFSVWIVPQVVYRTRLRRDSICRSTSVDELRWYVERSREFQLRREQTGLDAIDLGNPPSPPERFTLSKLRPAERFAQDFLIGDSWRLLQRGRRGAAIQKAIRAIAYCPFRVTTIVNFARLLAVMALRAARRAPSAQPEHIL